MTIVVDQDVKPQNKQTKHSKSRRRTYVISHDFNDRVHVLFLEILCDSGKTLFDISDNTGQICMKFEADTPQKL